jgi:hypothetical protein
MIDKRITYGLLALGVIIVILAVLWDSLGIFGDDSKFGPFQIAGLIVGVVLVLAGAYLGFVRKPAAK